MQREVIYRIEDRLGLGVFSDGLAGQAKRRANELLLGEFNAKYGFHASFDPSEDYSGADYDRYCDNDTAREDYWDNYRIGDVWAPPGPGDDGEELRTFWLKHGDKMHCGFFTIEQLLRWFSCPHFRNALGSMRRACVGVYQVTSRSMAVGDWQTVFRKDRAELTERTAFRHFREGMLMTPGIITYEEGWTH